MSEEWKIQLKTDLDDSEARKKLNDLVNEYNDEPINIKINVDGEDGLNNLAKSLKSIKNLAKDISGIKINIGGDLGKIGSDISNDVKDSMKNIKDQVGTIDNVLADGTKNAVGDVVDEAENNVKKLQKNIEKMIKNFQNIDSSTVSEGMGNDIDKYIERLGELEKLDFKDIGKSEINNTVAELSKMQDALYKIKSTSNDFRLKEAFNEQSVKPFVEQMEVIRDVMDAKNLNLSGIDQLSEKLKNLSETSENFGQMKSHFRDIASSLKVDITDPLGLTKIKSVELAIKEVLKYKNELEKEFTKKTKFEVDTSKLESLKNEINKTNEVLDKLGYRLDSVGKSTEINLIDSAQEKSVQNMTRDVERLDASLDKIVAQINKMKSNSFADFGMVKGLETFANGFKATIHSLKDEDFNADNVKELQAEFDKLANSVKDYDNQLKQIESRKAFDSDLEKVSRQANGLKSAFQSLGVSRVEINKVIAELNNLDKVADSSIETASNKLKELKSSLKDLGKTSDNLGNIEGGLTQYIQTLNKLEKAQKKMLSSANGKEIAEMEKQIKRYNTALNNLEKGFKGVEKGQANALRGDSIVNTSNVIAHALEKIDRQVMDTQKSLNKLGYGTTFESITTGSGELVAEFKKINNEVGQLKGRIREALQTGDIDVAGVKRLQEELEQASNNVKELSKQTIDINCQQSIRELEEMANQAERTQEEIEQLNNAQVRIKESASQFSNETIDFSSAEKTASSVNKEIKKMGSGIDVATNSTSKFSSKIEGAFGKVSNAFTSVTIGELMEEGIENLSYAVLDTITGLDKAFTEFARVAPDNFSINTSNLQSLATEARQIGIDVGQSVEDVISGMSTALQAGAKNMEQATAIAKSSAIFQNVTDMSAQNASKAVSSLINQYYNMDSALSQVDSGVGRSVKGYNNLTEAMDLLNYAGNNFAISSEGVSQALQRGGSVLANYGISLADSVAMISGANESLQNPEKIGNGLEILVA